MDYGIIDARVSTENQEKGYSLDGQVKAGLAYAEQHQLHVPPEYIFQESHTGTDIDRPTIMSMRQVIKSDRRVKFIIVYSLDRLARTALGLMLLEREFRKAGVKVVYVRYEFDDTPEGQLQKQIYASFSEFERATITQRFSKGRKDKVESCKDGQYLGTSNPPYGYYNHTVVEGDERRPVKHNWLKVHPEESRIVRQIFEWLAYGDDDGLPMSVHAIARKLTLMRVPSPYASRRNSYKRKIPPYQRHPFTITSIVRREIYATGLWFYGMTTKRNGISTKNPRDQWLSVAVPTIISPELWHAAVRQLEENKHATAYARRADYLLAGRITCALCGRPFRRNTHRPDSHHRSVRHSYVCAGKDASRNAFTGKRCSSGAFKSRPVDELVWKWLEELFSDPARVLRGLRERQSEKTEEHSLLVSRVETLNEELAREYREIQSLMVSSAQQNLEPGTPAHKACWDAINQKNEYAKRLETERAKWDEKLKKIVVSDEAIDRAERAMRTMHDTELVFARGTFAMRRAYIEMLDVRAVVLAPRGENAIIVQASCCISESGIMKLTRKKSGDLVDEIPVLPSTAGQETGHESYCSQRRRCSSH